MPQCRCISGYRRINNVSSCSNAGTGNGSKNNNTTVNNCSGDSSMIKSSYGSSSSSDDTRTGNNNNGSSTTRIHSRCDSHRISTSSNSIGLMVEVVEVVCICMWILVLNSGPQLHLVQAVTVIV